jgi:transglutaminase-like putative cysteine protease
MNKTLPAAFAIFSIVFSNLIVAHPIQQKVKIPELRESCFDASSRATQTLADIGAEDRKVRNYLNEVRLRISEANLSSEIVQRQDNFVREYDSRYAMLVRSGPRSLNAIQPEPQSLQRFERRTLPSRQIEISQHRAPRLSQSEWITNQSSRQISAGPPGPADLEETLEVKFTTEIRQLSDSLERNPVKVFNWVRNNIEFVPTWGSIQGAALCLETRVCNAFDTSSLLIALLRASGIPSRYQMGAIEVPVQTFNNWAGGFTNAEASASLFASGGVPSVVRRVNQIGQPFSVRLEHIWVAAYVDYGPSGGAVNRNGDVWINLDPAFKQYTVHRSIQDLATAVPFNRDAYLASTATESPVQFYKRVLEDHVRQNFPGRSFSDFLNTNSIRQAESAVLGGALPYKTLVRGASFSEVPDSLRHKIAIRVGTDVASDYAVTLPELLSKRLTLSFVPATPSDLRATAAFEGLYQTPPYLIRVRPLFRLNNVDVATGPSFGMGQTLRMTFTITVPGLQDRVVENEIVSGSYLSFFPSPHVISDRFGERLAREFDRADQRFGTLNLDNSDRDPWIGGGLHGLGAFYFNQLDAGVQSLKEIFPVGELKTAFIAYTTSDFEPTTIFGAPAGARLTSMSIDADLLEDFAVSRDGAAASVTAFEELRGLESSYWEHAIFDVAGIDAEHPSLSTVRILKNARASNIPVLEINASNLGAVEPQLQLSTEVKEAVRDAINAGLEVTIPAAEIRLGPWRGVGYIIEDPQTGAGAYQITGGLSGGRMMLIQPGLRGGTLPATEPLWPSAVLAVGTPIALTLGSIVDHMLDNQWSVLNEVGLPLHAAGYNVYINEVLAETISGFVSGSGAQTNNDLFFFVGHGYNGTLVIMNRNSVPQAVSGSQLGGRRFRIVLLSACATGSTCQGTCITPLDCTCTPNVGFQEAWEAALLGPNIGPTRHNQALVGSTQLIHAVTASTRNRLFMAELAGGATVGEAESFIETSYLRGDPATRLRGFGR